MHSLKSLNHSSISMMFVRPLFYGNRLNLEAFFWLFLWMHYVVYHLSNLLIFILERCQYRNTTTVLTREYLDARPDGWLEYAAKRIAQLYDAWNSVETCFWCSCIKVNSDRLTSQFSYDRGADKCYNRSLCEEHLNLLLPSKPPFYPRQFERCAVVGNSGDLLKTEFGTEIDGHDAVFRDNEAPVNLVFYYPSCFNSYCR